VLWCTDDPPKAPRSDLRSLFRPDCYLPPHPAQPHERTTRLTVAISQRLSSRRSNKLPEKGRSKAATFHSQFRNIPQVPGFELTSGIEGLGKDPMIRSLPLLIRNSAAFVSARSKARTYVLLFGIDKHGTDAYRGARRPNLSRQPRLRLLCRWWIVEASRNAVGENNAGSQRPAFPPKL